jgi:hypothetical protein
MVGVRRQAGVGIVCEVIRPRLSLEACSERAEFDVGGEVYAEDHESRVGAGVCQAAALYIELGKAVVLRET